MYYTVITHSMQSLENTRLRLVFSTSFSLMFSNARRVLSKFNTRLRLLYLFNIKIKNVSFSPCKVFPLTMVYYASILKSFINQSMTNDQSSTMFVNYLLKTAPKSTLHEFNIKVVMPYILKR